MSAELLVMAIVAALGAALGAWALTRVLPVYIPGASLWFRSRIHIPLAATGGFGAAIVADHPAILVGLVAAAVGCAVLVTIDFAVHRLPDPLVASTAAAVCVTFGIAAALTGGWGAFGRSLLAALVLVIGYFLLALIAPDGLGLGDVKFAAVIGLVLGWYGWSYVAVGTVVGFLLNGLFALVMLLRTRKAKGSEVPFGPSMVLGAVLAFVILG